ncbi:thiosulfate reductase [Salmonella enterica subsp. enterica]|uniref:Thiosulfate reductase n=1 Tax=Salmonella enterica I TaxID=59201 RepID=A0A379WR81_SALET|nr:thiosulfate reductase [Salmonella enterica subsp. enterica]
MVSFDPRLSIFSSKADEWHAIRPGGGFSGSAGDVPRHD